MKKIVAFLALVCLVQTLFAQQPYVYTIKADSVKITNTCDTAELIIENHTQNVPGFLFNKGKGRTEFRRGLLKINDSIYIVGGDTLRMNPWLQGGNRFGTTGVFGTMDNNNIDFYTNSTYRGRFTNTGNMHIGVTADNGDKLQVAGNGVVTVSANLSRPTDRIEIGRAINSWDGQNILFRTSSDNGASYRNIMVERDGHIGLGNSNAPIGWWVGNPALRINTDGRVAVSSNPFYFGNTGGPWNSSALVTAVSDVNEWREGQGNYPNRKNHYYFGTVLSGAEDTNVRAPLYIGARELNLMSGNTDGQVLTLNASRNVLIGATSDMGYKFQVYGNVFANGNQHKMGNLAIVSGSDVGNSGFATGIRIDDSNYGSFIFQGTNQGWAKDMFVFMDAFNGSGQDVFFPDQSMIRIKGGVKSNNSPGNSANSININPEYNLDPNSAPLTLRGVYYNPRLTSVISGCKHIAIETVAGDVLLGTTSGNTGVGTNSPTAQLHTTGTVRFGGLTNDNSQTRIVVSDANGNLYYRDASSLAMNETLNSDLAVNGRVSAQKMLITQTGRWPDYVFSKQYQLPSLTEVENFIKQNNHLPGMPSAAEVEKKGVDVGENQAALLKKIEELTLYTIQQDKELKTLKQEMEELKALIKEKK